MIGRTRKLPSAPKKPRASQQDRKHLNELLDEALEETFPASDALEMLEPAPDSPQKTMTGKNNVSGPNEAADGNGISIRSEEPCRSGR